MARPRATDHPGHLDQLVEAIGSLRELGEELEIHPNTLMRWSRGEQEPEGPARWALRGLCKQLGVPIPTIAERKAPRPSTLAPRLGKESALHGDGERASVDAAEQLAEAVQELRRRVTRLEQLSSAQHE